MLPVTIKNVKLKVKNKKQYVNRQNHLLEPTVDELNEAINAAANDGVPQLVIYTNNKYLLNNLAE